MDLKIFDKKILIMCVVVFILGLFARIYAITLKEDLHQDEALSVVLSNYSEYGWSKLPEENIVFSGKDVKQMMFWNDSSIKDMFTDIGNLYLYTRDDSHSNLYYSILRATFTGVDNFDIKQTIYRGCAVNLIAYCLAFFFMFKLLALLFKNQSLIPFGLFVAFLNMGSILNVAYLKPYQLQELAFVMVTYYFVRLLKGENINPLKISLAIVFSFLTGYYSLIYVGILAIILFTKNLDKKYLLKITGLSVLFTTLFYPGYFLGLISYRATETVERFSGFNLFKSFLGIFFFYFKYIFSFILIIYLVYLLVKISKQKLSADEKSKDIVLLFVLGLVWSAIILFIAPYKVLRYILPIFPIMTLIIPYVVSHFEKKIFPISIICSIVVLNFFVAVQLHKNSEIGKYVPFSQLDFLRNNLTNDYMFKRDISKPVFVVRPNGENLKIGKVIMLPSIAPYFDDNQKYIFINLNTKVALNNFYVVFPIFEKSIYTDSKFEKLEKCNKYYMCGEIKR